MLKKLTENKGKQLSFFEGAAFFVPKNSMNRQVSKKASRSAIIPLILSAALGIAFFYDSEPASAACEYPAQVLDLTNWKETLPIGSSKKPQEIKQPSLSTYSTNPYFRANADCSSVVFRAPVNGVTTSNSGYPRSELREMMNGGKQLASWSTTEGAHTLFIDQAITAIPQAKNHIVVGQIHDADDDVIVVRLEYPKLFIDINGKDGPVLDANYKLGKRFTTQFVAKNGQIAVHYNGSESPAYVLKKKGSGNYFKAGAYTQSNCSKEKQCDSGNFGEVHIYKLAVNHSNSDVPIIASTLAATPPAVTPAPAPVVESVPAPEPTPIAEPTPTPEPTPAPEPTPVSVPAPAPDVSPAPLPEPAPVAVSAIVSFEAESGTIQAPIEARENASASGGTYLVQTIKKGKGIASYTVNIPQTGRYQMKARVMTPNGSSNSISYAIDNGSFKSWHFFRKLKTWTWATGPTVILSEGQHTFVIKTRERNTQIDAFEFTPVAQYSLNTKVKEWFGSVTSLASAAFSGNANLF